RLKALIDLGLEQAAEQDPQRLLASFCAAARKIIGARYAVVAVTDQASRTLHYRFTAGMDASVANAVSEAVLSLTPERISSQHLQIASGDAQMAGLPPSHPPVHDVIREPIASLGQVFGCLFLANKLGEARFSAEDRGLARVMTAQLARIYANASLYAQVQRQMSNLETEIYERQRAQEEVQQLNAELEQRIAIRTAALKEANAELEAFSQTVAHDLQTPLRAVNGFAKLLNDQYGASLPPEGKRFLDVVSSNARSMHQLLENMLAFARFAQQSLNVRPLDMTTLAHQACNDVHEHYRARELDVHIDALPSAPGDPLLLRQVWHNLLDNACKFSGPQDPIRIEVGGRQRSTECLYWVRDFGQGFASDQAGQLFSSFRRGSSMASDGVGLSVCKRIIQRHGGSIWADGAPGAGATFWFTLPRTAGGE
ncbi:MAG TPA: ATP-binding protein, partial [Candidatus Kapabacteria bacterium]|nr:ATP-binding protein [Candidatus Kapabacteria bacterium]